MLKGTMKKEDENVLNALADLGTDDIMSLIEKGRNKEAIIIGVKMGLTKEDVKKTIKDFHSMYGFTHKCSESGQEIKPNKESTKK